ncbi:diaminopimelate epimerase [Maridesulfovibrio ferrireducens]|uniref:diaminopimelate epimerase n=1 Tax=Maridesulfovibrio ferrireducens TaxID=246191 RepID=UPI001A1C2FA4|nr:diaminopimelate epimerase [Maridesulfovibrio ferrireducens]MBI9111085.1 diaminopimelate epimerase [Maridesulfovibrio ferrireducens]
MSQMFGKSIPFYKMQGCGNDFVVIDNRELGVPVEKMPEWAEKICKRAFGIYADGLFFIENADEGSGLDFKWQFYNSDGSRAEMCGNASRCVGRLAHALGIAGEQHTFGSDAGPIKVQVFPLQEEVKVQLPEPKDVKLNQTLEIDGVEHHYHFANTGVPHIVVQVADVETVDIKKLGSAFRYHKDFAPAGSNVNFVQIDDNDSLIVRTYERGVEDETYACGTGVSAVQVTLHRLGLTDAAVRVKTSGGEILKVIIEGESVFLQGGAELTFSGQLFLESLNLDC